MLYTMITKQIISMDSNGNLTVINTETNITPMPTQNITEKLQINKSNKDYNYISLGRHSKVDIPKFSNITIVCRGESYLLRTHKTQKNRCDKMKPILDNYSVGQIVDIDWNPNTNTLTFF